MKKLISALFTLALVAFVGMSAQAQSINPGDAEKVLTEVKTMTGVDKVMIGKDVANGDNLAAALVKGDAVLTGPRGKELGTVSQDGMFTPSNSVNPGDGNGETRKKGRRR